MIPLKNKGMFLETILNITNKKYNDENICLVNKIPTNFKILSNEFSDKRTFVFDQNYNCDYIGVYKGEYIEFEAKETSKKYFDFNLIRNNQNEKMQKVNNYGGLSFLIIYFSEFETYFLADYISVKQWVFNNKKRVPYEWFTKFAYEIFLSSDLKLDYLKGINNILKK
ncbi:Holliday junction resolvase RecU [Mesoplasma corruscae]|uniref:Holliday junction resolvase RecU n=1 Tax=Mesoplasma corruscae TaxID=216874 RepID=A0A2S5RGX5_9MOLU|nr:Holliday junction resolvase RecU [Mesoplasma corruscae]PPE06472.1 Holliday junction-specific endonuclease [Mesoplasma corruscae]